MASAAPPAANGTTTRTGFAGHSAAYGAPCMSGVAAMAAQITASVSLTSAPDLASLFHFRPVENVQHTLRVGDGHRRRDIFELQRLFERHLQSPHLGKLQTLLGKEFVASLLRQRRSEEHTSELQSPYDLVCRL